MPRPVVPSRREPRKRSVTLSSTRLYGGMRWALALTTSRDVSIPRASSASISWKSTARSMTTPLPMTGVQPGLRMPLGQQVQGVLLAVDDDGVAGVVAPVELHDVVDAAAQQVGRLALAFVAPLGSDQHDRRHPGHLPRIVGRVAARPAGIVPAPSWDEPRRTGARGSCDQRLTARPSPDRTVHPQRRLPSTSSRPRCWAATPSWKRVSAPRASIRPATRRRTVRTPQPRYRAIASSL